ncbi:hypothetical protein AEA09_11555 [Lysinibacillus contaminans]|uniref:Uncharacterized protein n=1 Tax=Lysinibacillus contaminans TaxID=1293441 RepID=A0ABR5K2K4_9BACI|nr:hypothetical protein AEA09_11555 [Lysinibacillus contaminans]
MKRDSKKPDLRGFGVSILLEVYLLIKLYKKFLCYHLCYFFIIMKYNFINKERFFEEWEIPKKRVIKYSLSTNLENKQLVPKLIEARSIS